MMRKRGDDDPYDNRKPESSDFEAVWPSETKGDGRPRANNINTGAEQGKSTLKRKAACQQCGFLVDLARDAHDGGTLDGNGAGGAVAKSTITVTVTNGDTFTEETGNQPAKRGGGCPMCFSRNSSASRMRHAPRPMPRPHHGF